MACDLFSVDGFFNIHCIIQMHSRCYVNYKGPLNEISNGIYINKCFPFICNVPKLKAEIGTIYFIKFIYLTKPRRRLCGAVDS